MSLTQINKAGLDELALDHVFTIGASGNDHYTFQGEGLNGTVNDPTLYLTRGKTYRFENGSGGHPIRIQSTSGASGTAYNTGVTNNAQAGTVIVEVQHDAPDVLYYQCTSHAAMNGILYITGALADGGVTTAKIANDAVNASKIADGAIDNSAKIGGGIINNTHMADNAINTAEIADEAVTLAKLEHGTSSNDGKFLRANNGADPTFETVTGTTINNNADNRVITGSGTANTLEAESSVVIDSSSRLLVGKTASKSSDGENTAKAQIESTGNCMLDIAANGTTSSSYAGLNLIRSDGSSVNDHTAVDSGDRIGRINFIGADGSDRFNACASIRAFAAADFSANNCPGFLTFLTNSGGAAPSERIRIDKDGKVGIGTTSPTGLLHTKGDTIPNAYFETTNAAGSYIQLVLGNSGAGLGYIGHSNQLNTSPTTGNLALRFEGTALEFSKGSAIKARITNDGLCFGSDTAAANALDDYEEGHYVPTMYGQSGTTSFDLHSGESKVSYQKVGNTVTIHGRIRINNNNFSGAAYMTLPFTAADNDDTDNAGSSAIAVHGVDYGGSRRTLFIETGGNSAYAWFLIVRDNASWLSATSSNLTSGSYLSFVHSYKAA